MRDKFFNLEPRYDGKKSFYGKAIVVITNNDKTLELWSYETRVATFNYTTYQLELSGAYSMTTKRHIREFMHLLEDQYGCHGMFRVIEEISKTNKIRSFREFLDRVGRMNFMFRDYRVDGNHCMWNYENH